MENVNKITKGFPAQTVTKVIAMMALVVTFAACGNKGGGDSVNTLNGLVTSNCSGCSSITNPLAIGTVAATNLASGDYGYQGIPANAVNFSLNLYVNGNQFVPGSSSSYNLYSGPAALQGQMVVSSEWYYSAGMTTCRIPVGTYNVQTTSVATMSTAGLIPRMELYATSGSNSVRMIVDQGMLLNYNGGYVGTAGAYRLSSGIGVIQVNGYTCPSSFGMFFQ
ncbi:MAG: hypothetical protein ACM3MG_00665 [Bacillota bacterium]